MTEKHNSVYNKLNPFSTYISFANIQSKAAIVGNQNEMKANHSFIKL